MILGFALIAPVLTVLMWSRMGVAALIFILVSHLLVIYPTLNPLSQWLGPVMTRFKTKDRRVWLTIDDGPDVNDTPRILDLLDRHAARVTFFVKGESVAGSPALAREITARGHTVENHSMSHPSATFWCLPPGKIGAEIDRCSDEIEKATGRRPRLFRPPVGMKNPFVHPLLRRRSMVLVGWSARGFDGVNTSPETAARRILRNVRPGTIILAHQGRFASDGSAVNYRLLELILASLSEQGYEAVIPDESELET